MFRDSVGFEGKGLRYWNVGHGIYFQEMFMVRIMENYNDLDDSKTVTHITVYSVDSQGATSFIEHIDNWNVTSAEDTSMMFMNSKNFNADLGEWKLKSSKSTSFMFHSAESFDANLCHWQDVLHRDNIVKEMFVFSGCPITADPVLWYRYDGLSNRSHFCTECPQP